MGRGKVGRELEGGKEGGGYSQNILYERKLNKKIKNQCHVLSLMLHVFTFPTSRQTQERELQ